MNFDQIRAGRTLEIEAHRFAAEETLNMNPSKAETEYPRIYADRLAEMVKESNHSAVASIPAAAVQLNEQNRSQVVKRYTLKEGISNVIAKRALKAREDLLHSVEWSGDETELDAILEKAFDVHEVTFEKAMTNPKLKRSPTECLSFGGVTESQHEELPMISAGDLMERLGEKGMTHAELGRQLGVHHKICERWCREGVDTEHIAGVRSLLS